MFIADTLSRAPGPQAQSPEQDERFYVHTIQNLPITSAKIEQTNKDSTLQGLNQILKSRWP